MIVEDTLQKLIERAEGDESYKLSQQGMSYEYLFVLKGLENYTFILTRTLNYHWLTQMNLSNCCLVCAQKSFRCYTPIEFLS